jgi:hypothetical protein
MEPPKDPQKLIDRSSSSACDRRRHTRTSSVGNPIHLARIPSWMKIVCGNKSTKGRKARKPYQRIMNYEPRGGSSHPEYEFSERASSRSAAQLALPANATSDLWTRRVVVPVHPWPLPGCSAQVKVSSLCPRMLHYQPLSPLIRRA